MNSNWFKIFLKMRKVKDGKDLTLKGVPVIFNSSGATLEIGDGVTIKSSFLSNLVGLYSRSIIVTRIPGAVIKIGDRVGISGATIYARERIEIGDDTLIGGNVKILDNDFHPVEPDARRMNDNTKLGVAPICIGKNCFIGVNAIILKGTQLGDNCVVGAGSVVTGKFPANSVIAGNPAKVIKEIRCSICGSEALKATKSSIARYRKDTNLLPLRYHKRIYYQVLRKYQEQSSIP